ncbi:MAG: glycosyltransferase, partial [Candidatus Goldbacteria bacterium]|nr:glycosyltransferase [Candidatus Goldiibacteriota bacterium]
KYGIDKHFILYVGNNMPHKNVRLLYDSYISLPYDIKKDYQLVMIGFKDIFNSYPLARVIEKVDDDELACFYSGASLFVFPSLYEGFGYPPLEALKCGAKVVSSNLSCLPEILKDYVFYFNPYNRSELIDLMIQVLNGDIKIEKKPDFSLFSIDCFISEVKKIFGLI